MFNFWKKQPKAETKNVKNATQEPLALVKFSIMDGDVRPRLAIDLDSYDDNAINALCSILALFQEEKLIVEIFNFIQNHFLENGKENELLKIILFLGANSGKLSNTRDGDKPCIKPSEAMTQ